MKVFGCQVLFLLRIATENDCLYVNYAKLGQISGFSMNSSGFICLVTVFTLFAQNECKYIITIPLKLPLFLLNQLVYIGKRPHLVPNKQLKNR